MYMHMSICLSAYLSLSVGLELKVFPVCRAAELTVAWAESLDDSALKHRRLNVTTKHYLKLPKPNLFVGSL